ncbi:hypothetical protein HY745_01440 [Candidatus Desantisbacteria bacterium]|nr:hypothetical protein [Candidatus Desantisbacteria bacterium]
MKKLFRYFISLSILIVSLRYLQIIHAEENERIIVSRYPSGAKNTVISIIDQKTIIEKEYHENGKIRFQQKIINGYADGDYTSWFPNGKVSVKGNYSMGKPTGTFIYYREDGTISGERAFTKDGEPSAEIDKKIAEDAKAPEPLASYKEIFEFIARENELPSDPDTLLKIAADSILRRHQKIGEYEEIISIEAEYRSKYNNIRGAHNSGNFYIFGKTGKTYKHIGTLRGAKLNEGTINGELLFKTRDPWRADQGQEIIYKWNGRRFMKVEDKLYQYDKNGEKKLIKDFLNEN